MVQVSARYTYKMSKKICKNMILFNTSLRVCTRCNKLSHTSYRIMKIVRCTYADMASWLNGEQHIPWCLDRFCTAQIIVLNILFYFPFVHVCDVRTKQTQANETANTQTLYAADAWNNCSNIFCGKSEISLIVDVNVVLFFASFVFVVLPLYGIT